MVVAAMQGTEQQTTTGVVFDMQTRGIEPVTFHLQDAGSTSEPQPLYISIFPYW